MQPLILLVADHAYIDNLTGKLYVLGAFNNIGMKQFPGRHERMSLVIRIGAELGDSTEERTLAVILMDEDADEVLKLTLPFALPINPDGSRPYFDMVGELGNVIFPRPGRYVFRIYAEDNEIGSIPVDITQFGQ